MKPPHATPDRGEAIPLLSMDGRRRKAEIAEAFDALLASLRAADVALARRPRQLAELNRAVSALYQLLFVQQPHGRPAVVNLLEQHDTRLAMLEELYDGLRARLDGPLPLRAAGGRR